MAGMPANRYLRDQVHGYPLRTAVVLRISNPENVFGQQLQALHGCTVMDFKGASRVSFQQIEL
jgi:hypothetical protein